MTPPPLRSRWACRTRGRVVDNPLDLAGPPLDPGGIADLIAWGAPLGNRSMIQGVHRVRAPWTPARPDPHPGALPHEERADRLWALLLDAVRAAGPGTVTLSGGLDSRAILAAAVSAGVAVKAATFGDPDCVDHPVAEGVAYTLEVEHSAVEFDLDVALEPELRVWKATGGVGGPAFAPGASTDLRFEGPILSGTSGDVIWGDTKLPPPASRSRLLRLGVRAGPSRPRALAPRPPPWLPRAGRVAWVNLWTRQASVTWGGSASRRVFTPVLPVLWHEPLLAFCLALSAEDRAGRSLLRFALARNAPRVADIGAVRGPVHDLDRAFRTSAAWREALGAMVEDGAGLRRVGLRPGEVRRLVRSQRRGRDRAAVLSRIRALWRWSQADVSC